MKRILAILLMFIFCKPICGEIKIEFPEVDTLELTSYANFDFAEISESSALIKSRQWDDLYWTLNDSGGKNRIFPISRAGKLYRAQWYDEDQGGIYIGDAVNIDWESMTTDDQGNIYIGACGNNQNIRRDLCIYVFMDPHPIATGTTRYYQKINFYYPEQTDYPAPETDQNYDCEAIFWAGGRLFLLTKHRSDTKTCLYTINSMHTERRNSATLIDCFDVKGMVTGAESNNNGTKLAVLTYYSVWLFEGEIGNWFEGKIWWLPIKAKQCEGICFDDDETLLITNEQMEMFELKTNQLIEIR